MLSLFQRKRPPVAAAPTPPPVTDLPKGLLRPESAASLLATPRRQKLLEHIWQRTSLSRRQFATLYRTPLERYAELVQAFPASEAHHHAYPGGMLDHGLEIVAYSLKLRQSHLLPIGASPEDQAAQSEAWTAAVAYAALLHDIGKIAVDLHVELADGSTWHPWHGPLHQAYRFRYRDDREYRLHSAATGLLYRQLLDRHVLDWLSDYPALWAPLLYVLAGQYEHAGVLGELVVQADRASVAQELGGDPARAMAAPKHALQRKLLDGLRYLLKEQLKLNQPEASDGWLTEDGLWLVSKTVIFRRRLHGISGVGCTGGLQRGVQGRLAHLEPCSGLSDIKPVGDVLPRSLQLVGGDNRLSPALPPTSGGGSQPGLGALADQVALELAQRAEHVEDEPPAWRGGVDGFRQRTEADASRFQRAYRFD